MKKSVFSLTLLLALLATTGCSESAKAKKTEVDGNKVDVMYTYTEGDEEKYVTADDVYGDLLDTTAGSKALFDAVYKKVIESRIDEDKNKEIKKEVDEEMVTWLQDAKDQASDNGVSRDTMIDSLLEEEGVDSTDELTEKKIYDKQKKYVEEEYFDSNRGDLVNEYVAEYLPVHIKGILVKVADTNYSYFARSITEDETKKLARTAEAVMRGDEFNLLAANTLFSDHSTSQITTGGDLGIMDVTTAFNNEYKLGIYSYFAYNTALGAEANSTALKLLTNNDATLVSQYNELYKDGFNVITAEQVETLKNSAEVKKYADGSLVNSNATDGDYKTLNLARNVIYNNYFNSHKVSFLEATATTTYKATVKFNVNGVETTKEVVGNKLGYPIIALTDENGFQLISIEMDAFGGNLDLAKKYFGSTDSDKVTGTLNGTENKEVTAYFAQADNSNKTSRKEAIDTQIRTYINKGYGSSVSANQDFYYYAIYDEFVKNSDGTNNVENLKALYGDNFETEGTKGKQYYDQVTYHIDSIKAYREQLIKEAIEDTGEAFAETLALQDMYYENGWDRPLWLATTDAAYFALYCDKEATGYAGNGQDLTYWNTHLGGGQLYEE